MQSEKLRAAFAKIKRAETHINDLNSAIRAFLKTSPYRLVFEVNAQGTEQVWRIQVDPISDDIEAIAADAVHNLRTPLDKMVAALAIQPNGP